MRNSPCGSRSVRWPCRTWRSRLWPSLACSAVDKKIQNTLYLHILFNPSTTRIRTVICGEIKKSVSWNRDILVRIQIRILGSVPLTKGSGCGSVPKYSVSLEGETFVLKFYFATINSVRSTHLWEKGRIRAGSASGSVLVTNESGYGSGRLKKIPILRVQMQKI